MLAALRRSKDWTTRLVVAAYVVLAVEPFVHAWFWTHKHGDKLPIATVLYAVLILGLVLRRRWAWFVLVAFDGFALLSYAWEWSGPVSLVWNLVAVALLVSPPMRRYVRSRPPGVGTSSRADSSVA
jgi:hypothetical protein